MNIRIKNGVKMMSKQKASQNKKVIVQADVKEKHYTRKGLKDEEAVTDEKPQLKET